jgi:hypothetical protein
LPVRVRPGPVSQSFASVSRSWCNAAIGKMLGCRSSAEVASAVLQTSAAARYLVRQYSPSHLASRVGLMAKKKAAQKPAAQSSASTSGGKKRPIETYEHRGQKRANNPPVGLVTPDTDPAEPVKKTYQYDPHLDPQLVWAGKAEGTSFAVPTVSLHVHERIDPKTIIAAVRSNGHTALDRPGKGGG